MVESTRVIKDERRQMLNATKTISYNDARKVSFLFFDRATAKMYAIATVSFQREVYQVANAHQPATSSV